MFGSGHSCNRADGLKYVGGGMCHFAINLAGSCLSDEPSGLQQEHHVTRLAPVVVENLVIC